MDQERDAQPVYLKMCWPNIEQKKIEWVFVASLSVHIGLGLSFLAVTATPIALYSTFQSDYDYALIAVFFALWIYSVTMHILAGKTDPGYLPKHPAPATPVDPDSVKGLMVNFICSSFSF